MTDLTFDQRWLLYVIGGWPMRDCLISPTGTDHFMASMSSCYGRGALKGGPAWMSGWETRNSKITAPGHGSTHVVVSKKQLNAYARDLNAGTRAELVTLRDEDNAEVTRTYGWCHCPWAHAAPNPHSSPCGRYHPSPDEDAAHHALCAAIAAHLDAALRDALRIDINGEATQLALFDPL